MSILVAMMTYQKGNPGNGYRPEAGTVCLISGSNCDDENGYTWGEREILWRDDVFVLYRKPGCWPVLAKWDHILAKPLDSASSPTGEQP